MKSFSYYMPTKIYSGRGCIRKHGEALRSLGKRALIVTGRSSKTNGALDDVTFSLRQNGQSAAVYDRVTPNPTVGCVREGVALLKREGCDFVMGVGGGSPMDAAKAIAALALQPRGDEEIFNGGYGDEVLPMAHVPTTAGTGSEVTPYAILTNTAQETKTSISCPAMFPRFAFLDGRYIDDLPRNITVNTALDALSHAVESVLARTATPLSEALSLESMKILFPLLKKAHEERLTEEDRDSMLYASALAGMAIAQSGTTLVHGMGYSLTYFYGIDHGRANGLLLGQTLLLCSDKNLPQTDRILSACSCTSVKEFDGVLAEVLGKREDVPRERLEEFARRAMHNKNLKKSLYEPTEREALDLFLRSFGRYEETLNS